MKSMRLQLPALVIALLAVLPMASLPASAADLYAIDATHSSVGFKVKHLVSKVPGRFTSFSGTIRFDAKTVSASSVDVTIDATSINTDNPKRDAHLKSPDFLDAEKFPTMTFKSTKLRAIDKDHFEVVGDLTIHGVTKPVTLQTELLGISPGFGTGQRIGFQATTTINRKDFGVSWNKVLDNGSLLVGEEVQIEIAIEAEITKG